LNALKLLIVNADDFGFTRDVNQGILEAHLGGIVTAATLMATGAAFDHAVELARSNPTLDVGCHLVLVGRRSALPPHDPLPSSLAELVRAVALGRIRVLDELRAQVLKILDAGLAPTHLDTHKHTHLLPPVTDAVGRLSEEFRIGWVRRPVGLPVLGACLRRALRERGCRITDHFRGFSLTGRLDAAAIVRLLRGLPRGTTELMCHPGCLGAELRAAHTRLKESRERELGALTSPEVKQAIQQGGIRLVNYRSLA
jgi:predicted glycoside hydrolase/deacetylase ChbG (UPF0249 family)